MEHPKTIVDRMAYLADKIGRMEIDLADAKAKHETYAEVIRLYDEHFAPKQRDDTENGRNR